MQRTRSVLYLGTKIFLAGQLALSLAFGSSPAFALRQTGLEEGNPNTKRSLIAQLTTPAPVGNWNNAPRKIDQPPVALATAGAEEAVTSKLRRLYYMANEILQLYSKREPRPTPYELFEFLQAFPFLESYRKIKYGKNAKLDFREAVPALYWPDSKPKKSDPENRDFNDELALRIAAAPVLLRELIGWISAQGIASDRIGSQQILTGGDVELDIAAYLFQDYKLAQGDISRLLEKRELLLRLVGSLKELAGLPVSAAGAEEPASVLTRVPMGDFAQDLDEWLKEHWEAERQTEHYGEAQILLRVVEHDDGYGLVGAIAAQKWVARYPGLGEALEGNLSWEVDGESPGPGLVQIALNRYRFKNSHEAVVIERVHILPGTLRLEYRDELEIRSDILELIGEWGRSRGTPVYLIRPEAIRENMQQIGQPLKESTISHHYDKPVNREIWYSGEDSRLVLRGSSLTPEKELRWFLYHGHERARPAAGAEEGNRIEVGDFYALVADDDPAIQRLLSIRLQSKAQQLGVDPKHILIAGTVEEALELIAKHKPQFVSTDMNMGDPQGRTGADVAKAAKGQGGQLTRVILVATLQEGQTVSVDVDRHIKKPITGKEVEEALAEFVEQNVKPPAAGAEEPPLLTQDAQDRVYVGNGRWFRSNKFFIPDPSAKAFLQTLRKKVPLNRQMEVLNVGVGPWSIALGIADRVGRLVAVDKDPVLARWARENASDSGLSNVKVLQPGAGEFLPPAAVGRRYDLIIAAPPLMPFSDQMRALVRSLHSEYGESFISMNDGGPDGHREVDRLLENARSLLKPGGSLLLLHPQFLGLRKTQNKLESVGLQSKILHQEDIRVPVPRSPRISFLPNFQDYIEKANGVRLRKKSGDIIYRLAVLQITSAAGAEEAVVAKALSSPDIQRQLSEVGFVPVKGGFLARPISFGNEGRLFLQAGLEEPRGMPKNVPIFWADEATVAGMLGYVKKMGVSSQDSFLFNRKTFTLIQAMAVLPLPTPASAILDPRVRPTAPEVAAILHISRQTGTIYVVRITQLTFGESQEPLLFIQIQA